MIQFFVMSAGIQTLNKLVQADKEVMHFKQIVSRYLQRFTNDNISHKRPQPSEPHTPQLAKRRKPQPKRVLHSPSAVSVCNKCILQWYSFWLLDAFY